MTQSFSNQKIQQQVMPVFNLRAQHANALPPTAVQTLTRSIEQTLASYATPPIPSSSCRLLLPSFAGDFTLPEAGKALALHLVEHMRPLDAEVPLVPDAYRCVSHAHIGRVLMDVSLRDIPANGC